MKNLKITFITLTLMGFIMTPLSYAKNDPAEHEAIAELKDAYQAFKDEIKEDNDQKRSTLKEAISDEERAETRAELENNKDALQTLKEETQEQIKDVRMEE